jgi:heme/copper-type cytochrome/quinol oxidase subunit 3
VSELVHPATDYEIVEGEPPELLGRNLNSAAHLFASATAFFFLAFVFGYFYLRSLNNAHMWQPKGITPSQGFGALVMAIAVISAVVLRWGLYDRRAERRPQWRVKGAIALAAGVVAVVLQVVEWTSLGFGPADGGYASVFFGWTAFQLLFTIGALFWVENILATSVRYRNATAAPPGHASGDPHREAHDIADPLALVLPGLEAASFYWSFVAALGVLAWIVLYLV